jgi:hypothetical protein
MRNLDIGDTREKLLAYVKAGLLSPPSNVGVPRLNVPDEDAT